MSLCASIANHAIQQADALLGKPCKPHRNFHSMTGYGYLTTMLRFHLWAMEQAHFPTAAEVATRFGTSNATSHRWLNALAECYGIDRPRKVA